MAWRAVLEGDDAERALAAVHAVASELARIEPTGPGFNVGHASRALLGVHLARTGDAAAGDQAVDALEQALDTLDQANLPWLLDGLAGVAWTAAHLTDLVDIEDETFQELDRLIGRVLAVEPWTYEWEYVLGLTGLSVYALERPGAAGDALLERAIHHLSVLAERDGDRITWRSPPTLLHEPYRDQNLDGYYNVGLAHGVVGVVMLLAEAAARDLAGARNLLPGAVRWLEAQDSGDPHRRFPLMIARGMDQKAGVVRDGWCYGDQAASAALVRAGQALGEPTWIELGLSAARDVARREPTIPLDPGFCHGAVGRAHMFNRLAQATGDGELAEAAVRWYRDTLAHRAEGAGLGGFVVPEKGAEPTSVLTGSIGIALGLLAAASPVEPGWDRAFLVALPPKADQ
jgi:hypothetical protein